MISMEVVIFTIAIIFFILLLTFLYISSRFDEFNLKLDVFKAATGEDIEKLWAREDMETILKDKMERLIEMSKLEAVKGQLEYNAKRQHFVIKDASLMKSDSSSMKVVEGDVSLNEMLKSLDGRNVTFIVQVD